VLPGEADQATRPDFRRDPDRREAEDTASHQPVSDRTQGGVPVNHKKGYLTAEQAARSKAAQVPGATIDENCRCGMVHVNAPAEPLDPNRNSGPSPAVRALVLARDGHCCVCCGVSVIGRRYSLAHRLRAGQGGKPVPSNLVTLAGLGG
jgi:hypothetical protein